MLLQCLLVCVSLTTFTPTELNAYWADWDADPYLDGIVVENPFDCVTEAELQLWVNPTQGTGERLGKRLVYTFSGTLESAFRVPKEDIRVNPYVDSSVQGVARIGAAVAYIDLWNDEEPWERLAHNDGNVNWDWHINESDLQAVVASLGSSHTQDDYDGRSDFDNNGVVDNSDHSRLISNMHTALLPLVVSSDKSTYSPGQTAHFTATLQNMSSYAVGIWGVSVDHRFSILYAGSVIWQYPPWESYCSWEINLAPGEEKEYGAEWDLLDLTGDPVEPGEYQLGCVINCEPPIEAEPLSIVVTDAHIYTLPMYAGWNMVALPCLSVSQHPASVFASVWEHCNAIWTYNTPDCEWLKYIVDGPLEANTLTAIVVGKGYLVDVACDATLEVSGRAHTAVTSAELMQGWNLVGCDVCINSVLDVNLPSECETVCTYDSLSDEWLYYVPDGAPFMQTLSKLEIGKAYWMYSSDYCSWTLGK